jgi:hypothetical protein
MQTGPDHEAMVERLAVLDYRIEQLRGRLARLAPDSPLVGDFAKTLATLTASRTSLAELVAEMSRSSKPGSEQRSAPR